jgi:hypothetical protein
MKKATLFVIIGISYIFVTRLAATLFIELFRNLSIARINTVLSLLASITLIFFYLYFYKEHVKESQIKLRYATILALMGSILGFIFFFKGFLILFHIIRPVNSNFVNVIIPWLSGLFSLYFFFIFHNEVDRKEYPQLKTALLLAILGSVFAIIIRTFLVINYFTSDTFMWLWNLNIEYPFIAIPLSIVMFFCSVYFFVVLYKYECKD